MNEMSGRWDNLTEDDFWQYRGRSSPRSEDSFRHATDMIDLGALMGAVEALILENQNAEKSKEYSN